MMNFRAITFAATLLLLLGANGCKGNNEQAGSPASGPQPVAVQPAPAPTGQAPAEAGPAEQPAPQMPQISGKVVETMNAAGYTYVNVETPTGKVWAALPETKVEVGQDVVLAGGMEMKNFESKTLGRKFDSVIFSSGIIPAGGEAAAPAAPSAAAAPAKAGESFSDAMAKEETAAPAGPMAGAGAPSSGGSAAAIVPSSDVKVEKAKGENAYTIGDVFAKKAELNGKKIMVRGKAVKVSTMIMGKNWIHLQDGTGDPKTNSHDLVVTTMADVKKDSVVEVEGTVRADKDFGSGYHYDVIIEDAEVK